MSFCMMVTRLAWIAHRFLNETVSLQIHVDASSGRLTHPRTDAQDKPRWLLAVPTMPMIANEVELRRTVRVLA